jgi:hypothetical protein
MTLRAAAALRRTQRRRHEGEATEAVNKKKTVIRCVKSKMHARARSRLFEHAMNSPHSVT